MALKAELLRGWLEITLSKIKSVEDKEPYDISALRELQSLISPLVFAREDAKIQFLAFFLNSYINRIFMDLLGDIPDDRDKILQTIRNVFFKKISDGLQHLSESIRNGNDPLPALQDLVRSYSEAVKEINYKDIQLEGQK
jgi:hypothetical protein